MISENVPEINDFAGLLKFKIDSDFNGSVIRAAKLARISPNTIYSHIHAKRKEIRSRTRERFVEALGITEEDISRFNTIRLAGIPVRERQELKKDLAVAVELLGGQSIDCRQVVSLAYPGGCPYDFRNTLVPLIQEVAAPLNIPVEVPEVVHREQGRNPKTVKQRLRQLKEFYVKEDSSVDLERLKLRNPIFLLGEAYQNLVGSLIRLANLDDRYYQEVALTYEKREGHLTRTKDIVDVLTLNGFEINKKKRTNKRKKICLYEVKLGRQRQGLLEQVKGQLDAAKRRWRDSGAEISSTVVVGNPQEGMLLVPAGFTLDEDLKALGLRETQLSDLATKFRQVEEKERQMQNLEEILQGCQGISILPFPVLVNRAVKTLDNKLNELREGKQDPTKGIFSALRGAERKVPGLASYLLRQYGLDLRELEEVAKVSDNLIDYSHRFSLLGLSEEIGSINEDIQSRNLSLYQIKKYDENLFLLNYYLRRKAFKKQVKEYDAEEAMKGDSNLFNELGEVLHGVVRLSRYSSEQRGDELNEEALNKSISTAERIKNFFRKVTGRPQIKLDGGAVRRFIFGKSFDEFWAQYLPNYKQLLERRSRMQIVYEEDGLYSEFKTGKRVIPKKESGSWILEALSEIGVNVSDFDLSNPKDAERALEILEEFKSGSDSENQTILFRQKQQLERLGHQTSALEVAVDDHSYGIHSNTQLHKYQENLKIVRLDSDQLISKSQIDSQKRASSLSRTLSGIVYTALAPLPKIRKKLLGFQVCEQIRQEKEEDKRELSHYLDQQKSTILKFVARTAQSARRDSLQTKAGAVYEIYDSFIAAKDNPNELQQRLVDYLQSDELNAMIDKNSRGIDLRDGLTVKLERDYLFKRKFLLERHLATRMMQTLAIHRIISSYNPKVGEHYLELSRQEFRTGQNNGSKQFANEVLTSIKQKYERESKAMAEYELSQNLSLNEEPAVEGVEK